ncbi:MAG: nucleoside monophosphate kinase [Candidatus Uhrbacteria bacterium]|nr:nucleoside monophosphate kinase [Candidatus Uhrbacteria bacterium]
MHRILIQGPQGCGKGTQAAMLSQRLQVPHLSMGQLLREARDRYEAIRIAQEKGELVPDEIVRDVLVERLAQPDCKDGYILDAFPRSESQYRSAENHVIPTAVIVINVPIEVSMDRMRNRARLEKRDDDTPEAMRRRLEIYEEETKPIIEKYRAIGLVRDVDGTGTIEEVADRIFNVCSTKGGC